MPTRVVFGTSSWGLGHATRDLVLLRALLGADCEVTVVATGQALRVLRSELGDACDYLDWVDMPSTIAKSTLGFYVKTVSFIPRILWTWFAEKRRLKKLLRRQPVDLVVSDHRYGMVTGEAPCYFITHSPRYIAPWRSWFMETAMEVFVAWWLRPVKKVLVPDEGDARGGGMSGDMSHAARYVPREKLVFLGFLSSVQPDADADAEVKRDVDVFISISGPEPQRTRLQETILSQIHQLADAGRVVVTLGLPGEALPPMPAGAIPPPNVEMHAYLDRSRQQAMMNRSRLMVCRSGYTTLMELAELGRRALLIPTPAQTEQLYLAQTLEQRGLFHSVAQHELSLERDVEAARAYPGYRAAHSAAQSAHHFLETVLADRNLADRNLDDRPPPDQDLDDRE